MRRREFITLLGGAAAPWPIAALAQQGGPVRRIGVVLSPGALSLLRQELQKLGWTEGRNLRIDVRFASPDPEQTAASARELIELAPDLIFTTRAVTTAAVQRQTGTIPIVFAAVGGLEGRSSVVRNIARPEGNTTGITNGFFSLGGKWLELLKDAAPRVARVAVIFNPDLNRLILGGGGYAAPIAAAATVYGVQVIWMPYRTAADLERAIDAFAAEPNGGLILVPPVAIPGTVFRLAAQYRLPAMYPDSTFADEGLMSYGANFADIVRQSASYVDRILRGTKVSELPVQFPTKFELVVNLKTAKAMGLTIPEAFLLRADEVIE